MSQAEALRMPTMVSRVVDDLLATAFDREVELTFVYPDDLPSVWTFEKALHQLLLALLTVSIDHTPSGGRINGFLGAEPSASAELQDGVRVTIIDSGQDPLDQREDIQTLIQQGIAPIDGRLWVDQLPEEGHCILLTLPGLPRIN